MMLVLITLALVVCAFVFLRKPQTKTHPEPVRHFEVRHEDGLWTFTVRPNGIAMPATLLAMLPGAALAVFVIGLWLAAGHDLDGSGVLFFTAWVAGTLLCLGPMRKRAQVKAAGTTFSVGTGTVILASGDGVLISGQYVLNRNNSAAYGQPAAYAHFVSLDVDGVSYVLADGMTDPQSMALYHEVGRRLRGDP